MLRCFLQSIRSDISQRGPGPVNMDSIECAPCMESEQSTGEIQRAGGPVPAFEGLAYA